MLRLCVLGVLLLVSAGWGSLAQAVERGQEIRRFDAQSGFVTSVAVSPDGRSILTGGRDNSARLWDVATGQELRRLEGHSDRVRSVAFSPDGRSVLTGSEDDTARLWDVATGRELRRFEGHSDDVLSVAFSPDGRSILTGGKDKTAYLWDAATGRELQSFEADPTPSWFAGKKSTTVWAVAFSPDGRSVLTGSGNMIVHTWNDKSEGDHVARLWDVATGREIQRFAGHSRHVSSVAFSPNGQSILTGSSDGTARLWDAVTGRELREFVEHSNSRSSGVAIFSPDGRFVLTGDSDNTARLWDVATGGEVRRFEGPSRLYSMAFSPDGRLVVAGTEGGSVHVWNTGSAAPQPLATGTSRPKPPMNLGAMPAQAVSEPATPQMAVPPRQPPPAAPPPAAALRVPVAAPPSSSPSSPSLPAGFNGPRRALVIAAKSYRNITPLERTITDARALAEALTALGFTVMPPVENPDRRALMLAVARFADDLRKNPGALAFVLFSGHGVAIDGVNYLLPVDFPAIGDLPGSQGAALIRADALALDALLDPLKEAGPRHLVALFDACRDNPLAASGSKSVGGTRGLARIREDSGAYVMFAAGTGEKALDKLPGADSSPHGVFMRHFLVSLRNPGWTLDKMFKETAKLVQRDARGVDHRQNPVLFTQDYEDILLGAP